MKIISGFMIIILLHVMTFSIYDIHNNAFAETDQDFETTKKFKIILDDSLSIYQLNLNENVFTQIKFEKKSLAIHLYDEVNILSQSIDNNFIVIHQSFNLTTFDRIFERTKIGLIKNNIMIKNLIENILDEGKLESIVLESSMLELIDTNVLDRLSWFDLYASEPFIVDTDPSVIIQDWSYSNASIDYQYNPLIVLLLVPLSGIILVKTEFSVIRFEHKYFASILVIILISSAVITPLSISNNYWGYAYADEFNESILGTTSTIPSLSDDSFFISDQISVLISSIPPNLFESTHIDVALISDQIQISINSLDTILAESGNTTDATSIFDTITILTTGTITNATNITTTDATSIFDTITILIVKEIPDANISIKFDNSTNTVTNQTSNETLQLDGDGDFLHIANVTSTNSMTELTVSSWVKPDYSKGSPEFTIVSKGDQFVLSINNIVNSKKTAMFSVFDGIKWTGVESTYEVEEKWTHLASTFNGTRINLYVNGNLTGTKLLPETLLISVDGKLNYTTIETISSEEDIVVGAYVNIKKGLDHVLNQFSGEIDDVSLFNEQLNENQITKLYLERKDHYDSLNSNAIDLDAILAEILAEQNLNSTRSITLQDSISAIDSLADSPILLDDVSTGISLVHDKIEIGKPVTWSHDVMFSNNTESKAIEIPSDAEILSIKTMDDSAETILYDSGFEGVSSTQNNVDAETLSTISGLYDDQDISAKDLQKYFRLVDSAQKIQSKIDATHDKISYYVDLDTAKAHKKLENLDKKLDKLDKQSDKKLNKLSNKVPLASLDSLNEMLQDNMPLKMLVINDTSNNIELKFKTPAPYTIEVDQSTDDIFNKKVTVKHESSLHYTDVLSYSDLPAELLGHNIDFRLFWNINGTKQDVTDDPRFQVAFVDTDDDGEEDRMQWTVPQLSEQEFEIEGEIIVVNVQSYPVVGGLWEVEFITNGTADLTISAINGTTWSETTEDEDLKFLSLKCGDTAVSYQWINNTVFVENYSCSESSFEKSKVITEAQHHLQFQFGNDVAYANNFAQITIDAALKDVTDEYNVGPNFVFTNATTAYAFYVEPTTFNLRVERSLNGGQTWADLASLDMNPGTDLQLDSVAIWYDQWTEGDTGDLIHIAIIEQTGDDFYYSYFDTTSNTFRTAGSIGGGGFDEIAAGSAWSPQGDGPPSITKSTTGQIYVSINGDFGGNALHVFSTDESNIDNDPITWTDITEPSDTVDDNDWNQLIALSGNRGDIMMIHWDQSTSVYDLRGFILNGNTGSFGSAFNANTNVHSAAAALAYDNFFEATINPNTGDVYLVLSNDLTVAGNDLEVYKFDNSTSRSSPSWQSRTNPVSNDASLMGSISVNTLNNFLYVTYLQGTIGTDMDVFWTHSEDDGNTWSGAHLISNGNGDDYKRISSSYFSDTSLYATWYNDDLNDLLGTDIVKIRGDSDSATIDDSIVRIKRVHRAATDSATIDDSIFRQLMADRSLADSATINDSIFRQLMADRSLADSATINDSIFAVVMVFRTINDSISIDDSIQVTKIANRIAIDTAITSDTISIVLMADRSLADSATINDSISTVVSAARSLADSATITGPITLKGSFFIEARSTVLQGGATYLITPSPTNGTGTLTIVDGDGNDSDPTVGVVGISGAPFSDYFVQMIVTPTGYVATVNATTTSVWNADISPLITFTLIDQTSNVSELNPIIITTAPILNATHIQTLSGFNAAIVNTTTNAITSTDDLPEIIGVGKNNTAAIENTISTQSNVKIVTNIPSGSTGTFIQNTLGMPSYMLPSNPDFTIIIPPTVTQASTNQIIATPLYNQVTSGQKMIIPVQPSLIPTSGGMLQLDITSKETVSSVGTFANDWIVVEITNQVVNAPTLSSSGISNELDLFIDVKYSFEENGVGFNWGDSNNYDESPIMKVIIPKPTSSEIITLANGCADVEVHTLVGGTWVSGIDTILSNLPSTTNSNSCDVEIQSDHYSKKSVSSKRSASSGADSSSSSSSSGGSGRTGVSGGAGGVGSGFGGFGGILGTPLTINEISYDRCDEHIARILVSSDADNPPSVVLHTAKSGTISAKLAENQPYEESNKITKVDKYLYEVTIDSDESFLMVVVTEEKGALKNTVQAAVRLLSCEGTTVIAKVPKEEIKETPLNVPRIFDTKFQINNGKQYRADIESEFYYVDNQDMTVTAIIDSQTSLQRVELRTIPMIQSDEDYVAVKMNIESLPISNSTYVVSATIPSELMQEPGIKYWIHVLDEDQNTNESKQYRIGVKPTTVSDVIVEMDVPTIRPTGSIVRPEVYVRNDNSPAFGMVSLVVDGKIVSKKSQLFDAGQTKVSFDWDIPASKVYSSNELQGRVDLYDKTITTKPAVVHSYPRTIAVSAYDMKPLELLVKDGKVLADPALIYASDSDENLRFRIIDPQGQCIIGATDECIVKESTKNNRGGLVSVNYGDQILRVRYSGSDNPLERFSITSIDPIIDEWTVTLETDDGIVPEAHAIKDTLIKIKHRYYSETITVKDQ